MHSRNLLHNDVKPDNFLVGVGKKSHLLHVIDYGLVKPYIKKGTNEHI